MSATMPPPRGSSLQISLDSPGPSRQPSPSPLPPLPDPLLDEADEDADRELFLRRQKEYTDLERSVEVASAELLTSLAGYLTTFQDNLGEVSGQISDLQARSDEIERELKGRRVILPPLNALLSDLIIPTSLVLTIRDTEPSANPQMWLQAIAELEDKMGAVKSRGAKVKGARELESLVDALALKALHYLPPFLLTLIRPLRSASKGLSTNLAVMQTSLLLKYQPFYAFLLRQSPRHAKQVERGYVNAARAYFETGIRRYARALGLIRARAPDKSDLIGVVGTDEKPPKAMYARLQYADLDGEGESEAAVVLAYQADDPNYALPVEAVFRSLGLVVLDNASAEFTFLVRFFARSALRRGPEDSPLDSPVLGPASDAGRSRLSTHARLTPDPELRDAERIWHEVLDSGLESATALFKDCVATQPPAIPLLTMIRANDRLISIAEGRGALPLIPYLTGWKMTLWPLYRKAMDAHIESLRALANEAEGRGLAGVFGKGVKDSAVRVVAVRYAALFACVVALSDESEEAMMFSNMTRLRAELTRLVQIQAGKMKDLPARHSFLSSIYEAVMHELVAGPGAPTHPRLQSELSFFRTREEEARRRIAAQ
ncbi:hypothetical protein CspeluHIS016_0401770 [Cutaneotrichosporon spelunceum]|uniref:Vps52-domain-containing protein n=1 Tax=Cutaneotrichosporon spelunceum TaxID=1672016 RepID=A0AAD3TUW5_9TREE|nr:hypothetical protein CspeluHIS016_0401770 [Cutaneotrichosporon spelunceum]